VSLRMRVGIIIGSGKVEQALGSWIAATTP
jgi:hypothetical protein